MATKAPTGLAIARDGLNFTCTWKRGQSYNKKQQFEQNLGEWAGAVDIGKAETTRTIGISLANFYPNTSAILDAVMFRVRGLQNRSWSAFTQYGLNLQVPDPPTITGGKDENLATTAKFTWTLETDDKSTKVFTDVEYQSVLIAGCNETNGAKLDAYFNSKQTGWKTGKGGSSDSRTITESSSNVASGSHTRWFRVRSRGPKGASAWRYASFVYAAPNAANITKATATKLAAGGYQVSVAWNAASSAAYPIDQVTVEYAKAIPDANMGVPTGANWTTARTLKQSGTSNAVSFVVDGDLANDQVLFVRVNTEHESQNEPTHSSAKIAAYGRLQAPTITNITTNDSTYRATITVEKETDVPGAFTVILYRTAESPSMISVVGVISSGTSYTAQLPNWTGKTKQFGAYNAVGTYRQITRQDGTTSFEVTAIMTSETEWDGGSVPNAPSEVTLRPTETPGTVKVTWDWPWTEADSATISWSDHADAWQSTDEPSEYTIENTYANEWNVSGLETGKRWFFRVRLTKGSEDNAINGAWSEIATIDLSSAPTIPTLSLSAGIIPEKGSVAAFWSYVSTDGTAQAYAEICEATISGSGITYGNVIASTQTAQHLTIYAEDVGWHEGETHYLCVRVVSASGRVSDEWSDPVPVIIAAPLEINMENTSLESIHTEKNPQTITGRMITVSNPDGKKSITELTASIELQQSGSGDPSPENIRPINGWNEIRTRVANKNLIAPNLETANMAGITYKVNADKSITINGTATALSVFYLTEGFRFNHFAKGETYKFKVNGDNTTDIRIQVYSNDVWLAETTYGIGSFTLPENSDRDYVRIRIGAGTTVNNVTIRPMIVKNTEDPSVWIEPQGDTIITDLGGTIYKGTLDLAKGLLTITHGMKKITGINRWGSVNNSYYGYNTAENPTDISLDSYPTEAYCDCYKVAGSGGARLNGTFYLISGNIVFVNDAFTSLAEANTIIANQKPTVIYPLAEPITYDVSKQTINLLLGSNNIWANCGEITSKYANDVRDYNALKAMPLTAKITGAGNGGTTTLIIERAQDYHVDRPNEEDFNGHKGETIAIITQTGEEEIIVTREDLLGSLDDGAQYNLIATIQDGLGQSATEVIPFEVEWEHQAVMPEATVRIEEGVVVITPVQPTGYAAGDTVDIYRLSADKPELIIKGAEFGTAYVDPFPAFNEFGGHRVVYRTVDGDYITAEGELAWIDLQESEGDYIKSISSVVDFDGTQIELLYDTTQSTSWTKDFRETRYLGGSVQGDWNKGVEVSSSLKTAKVTIKDQESMQAIRRLAAYPGVCHIRTVDGSSYSCDIQITVDRQYDRETIRATYSLDIIKVDPEELDGQTYEEWQMGE